MARLTYRQRKRLARSSFAIPSERKYPIENASHARNALARVSRFGSPAQKAAVCRAVHRRYPSIAAKSCAIGGSHGSHTTHVSQSKKRGSGSKRRCRTKSGQFTRCR